MYKALIVLCLAAVALADEKYGGGYDKKSDYNPKGHHGDGYAHGYGYNYAHGANKVRENHVNYYNGLRQHAVNAVAEHYGSGLGTAGYYGVPGTPVGVHGHGYGYGGYGYGHGGYAGHGYGAGYGYNKY